MPTKRLTRRSMVFVLAGGRGSRLQELTDRRVKPAVPFGGKFRIIDFALSNALNSGIRKMAIATQYKAHSLIRHVQRGWSFFGAERGEFLDVLPASQRGGTESWYKGTADAVTQNIDIVDSYGVDYVIILAGDHIYKMDYEIMLRAHVKSEADVTVGCLTVPRIEASAFGVMATDKDGRITEFLEKPADPPGTPEDPETTLASMGIYVFDWKFLRDFPAYWKDVGTVDAFWQANINLTNFTPDLDLWDRDWPVWTYNDSVPPAKFIHDERDRRGMAISSMISGGCIVSGTEVRNSCLFTNVHTNSYSVLDHAVVLPNVTISRSARLRQVVIDAGVHIPEGLVVGEDSDDDKKWFRVTARGTTLITQNMLDKKAAG